MNPQRRTLVCIVAAMALITTSVISLKWLRAPAVEARRDVAPPFPIVGQHDKEPTPTGAWFTNLLLDDGAPSVSTPYAVRFEKKTHALEISCPSSHRAITKDNIADAFVADLIVKTEKLEKPELVSYDELTAEFKFGDAKAYFARGSPFVTIALDAGSSLTLASVQSLKLQGSTTKTTTTAPIATSNRPQDDASCKAHSVCSNLIGVCCPTAEGVFLGCCEAGRRRLTSSSKRHKVTLGDGSTWLLHASLPIALDEGKALTASIKETTVLRLAYVPDEATEALLDDHASSYATSGRVAWHASYAEPDVVELAYIFGVVGNPSKLLTLALPHHTDTILESTMATGYKSLKGPLRGVVGEKWRFREPLGELKWDLGPSSRKDEMRTLLAKFEPDQDERTLASSSGVYSAGKRLYRLASIALAAHQVNDRELTRKHGLKLKKALRPWLSASSDSLLVYDASHGGVVTRAGYKDPEADFGNGRYNDHHFHYGYLVHSAAVAKHLGFDEDGAHHSEAESAVSSIVMDYCNPFGRRKLLEGDVSVAPRSTYVPVSRHKDWYEGHSWASGLFSLQNGKSQESISEAAHSYYGAALWGSVTGDPELRDFARLALALEVRAGRHYWRVSDQQGVYKGMRPFSLTHPIVGVVGALDVSSRTWFGEAAAYAVLINCLPFSPATARVGGFLRGDLSAPAAFAARIYKAASEGLPPVSGVRVPDAPKASGTTPGDQYDAAQGPWRSLLILLRAVGDAKGAVADIEALASSDAAPALDSTLSLATMLWWASTRPPSPEVVISEPNVTSVKVDSSCGAHPKCVALGLDEGDCCPTSEGDELWCCED